MDNATNAIRVLIADDHPLFREGLRMLLEVDPDIKVIAEAKDGKEAVDLAGQLKPDLTLMDLRMPRCSGIDALKLIQLFPTALRVLILATEIGKEDIMEVLKHGASGILLKSATSQQLRKSIHAVMEGEYWIERHNISDLIRELTAPARAKQSATTHRHLRLTPRERQIVREVAAGKTNNDISIELSLSLQTVKHHLTSIFDKLGVDNRLELALFSVKRPFVAEKESNESSGPFTSALGNT